MRPKEKREQQEITKLAIGKPGGVDPELDLYDTETCIYCYNCDKNLDPNHP